MSDLGSRLGHPMRSSEETAVDLLGDTSCDPTLDMEDLSSFFEKTTSGLVQDALAGLTEDTTTTNPNPEPNPDPIPEPAPAVAETIEPAPTAEPTKTPEKEPSSTPQTNGKPDLITDYKELEALVAESTSNYVKTTLHGLSPAPYQPTVPQSTSKFLSQGFSEIIGSPERSTNILEPTPTATGSQYVLLVIHTEHTRAATTTTRARSQLAAEPNLS